MNGVLVSAILLLALATVSVRRRSVAIAAVGLQSLLLGAGALTLVSGRSSGYLVASAVLAVKGVVAPALLYALMRQTREPRLVIAAHGPLVRLALTTAAALLGAVLTPSLGLADRHVERAAVALLVIGIMIVVLRRPALHQLLGLLVAENGLSLLAVSVPGGLSYVVELGALLDLVLVATVAGAFVHRIHLEFGTGDTEQLRGLRD